MSRPVAPPPPPSLRQYLEDTSHPNSSSSHASVHVAAFAGASDGLAGTATAGTVATGDRGRQHFSGTNTGSSTRHGVASVASVADLTLRSACRCPHLDAILPHILRMDRYDPIVEMHLGLHFGDVAPLTAGGKLASSPAPRATCTSTSASSPAPHGALASASVAAAATAAATPVGSPRGGAAVDAIRHSPNADHHQHHHQHQHRHSPTKTAGSPSPAARVTAIGLSDPSSPMSPAPTSSGRSSSQQRADRSVFGPEHARLLAVTGRGGAATTWCPVLPPLYQPSGSVGSKYSSSNTSGSSYGANNDKSSSKKRKGTSAVSAASPAAKAHGVQVSKDGAATAVSALTADDTKSNISPAAKAETALAAVSALKTAGTVSPTKEEPLEPKASVSSPTAPASSTTNTNTQAKADGKGSSEETNAVPPAKPEEKEEIGAQIAAAKGEDKIVAAAAAVPLNTKEIGIKNETKPGNAEVTVNANEEQVAAHGNKPNDPSNISTVADTNKGGDPTDNPNRIAPAPYGDKKDKPDQKKSDTDNVTVDTISSKVESPRANSHQSGGTDQMDVDSPLGKKLSNEKLDIVESVDNTNEGGEKNAGVSPSSGVAKSSTSEVAQISQSHHLPDPRYNQLRSRERRIMRERENVILKSRILPPQGDVRLAQQKIFHRPTKRKKGEAVSEGAHAPIGATRDEGHSSYERRMLRLRASVASSKVEEWLQVVRDGREAFYNEHESNQCQRRCAWCPPSASNCKGDRLMQCLECSVVGCGPSSTSPYSSVHMMCHFIASGHNFGITCGPRAEIFCMKCGDFIYHEVFDQEKERMDISHYLPQFSWQAGSLTRSYEPLSFVSTPDHGVVWHGMVASYPTTVSSEFVLAGRLALKRQLIFKGEMEACGGCSTRGPMASHLAIMQSRMGKKRCKIKAPVGMYNLGNTCFMSSVLQCLVNCPPIQRYFLRDIKHNHQSCHLLRSAHGEAPVSPSKSNHHGNSQVGICIACEMDRLMLEYYGSTIGHSNVIEAINEAPSPSSSLLTPLADSTSTCNNKCGTPLVPSRLLAATWKSGGMKHLAGYQQRDSHEFLSAFLDIMSKHDRHFADTARELKDEAKHNSLISGDVAQGNSSSEEVSGDIVKSLFAGNLRSVLICETCGYKRSQAEPFLNISLPITNETKTIEACLRHFTQPEALSGITCDLCEEKHPHTKQHTFAKLPKVLCLHLKRFDAATNKKISEFVSFPAQLNVGPFLPHWCEVIQGMKASEHGAEEDGGGSANMDANSCSSAIMYDLHATINHSGTLHQGHYVANVKVDGKWYHCNDAHVFDAGEGDGEKAVLEAAVGEAYMLFYMRRDVQW